MDSESIRNIDGQEAHLAALQFMGQQLGALKELDKSIISRSSTLNGVTLNPENILRTIPGSPLVSQPQPQSPYAQSPYAQAPTLHTEFLSSPSPVATMAHNTPVISIAPQVIKQDTNPDQLELNFTYDIARDIVDRLDRVEKLLKKVYHELSVDKQPSEESNKNLKKT